MEADSPTTAGPGPAGSDGARTPQGPAVGPDVLATVSRQHTRVRGKEQVPPPLVGRPRTAENSRNQLPPPSDHSMTPAAGIPPSLRDIFIAWACMARHTRATLGAWKYELDRRMKGLYACTLASDGFARTHHLK